MFIFPFGMSTEVSEIPIIKHLGSALPLRTYKDILNLFSSYESQVPKGLRFCPFHEMLKRFIFVHPLFPGGQHNNLFVW